MLSELSTIPRLLGQPLYPGGAPLDPKNHYWQETSAFDIAMKNYGGEDLNEDELLFLKEYVKYYALAPCWQGTESSRFKKIIDRLRYVRNGRELSAIEMELLDYGIDIF